MCRAEEPVLSCTNCCDCGPVGSSSPYARRTAAITITRRMSLKRKRNMKLAYLLDCKAPARAPEMMRSKSKVPIVHLQGLYCGCCGPLEKIAESARLPCGPRLQPAFEC